MIYIKQGYSIGLIYESKESIPNNFSLTLCICHLKWYCLTYLLGFHLVLFLTKRIPHRDNT